VSVLVSLDRVVSQRAGRGVHAPVTFAISRGECVCVLGRNGVGKSSLLHALVGLLPLHAGDIAWEGGFVPKAQVSAAEESSSTTASSSLLPSPAQTAFVPQRPVVPEGMTVDELLRLGAYRFWGTGALPSVGDTLARVGLRGFEQRLVCELSGGELQRAMLARALMQQSQLLVLDEPTAHLDLAQRAQVLSLLRGICGVGTSVLFTSHSPDDAVALADTIVLLGDAQVRVLPERDASADDFAALYGIPVRAVGQGRARVFVAG
jgi:iron complex transport system ATP-binding protein